MKAEFNFSQPLVAYDNSRMSQQVLNIVDSLSSHFQKVTVVNVYDPIKNYIPLDLRGQHIKDVLTKRYKNEAGKLYSIESKTSGEKKTDQIILETFVQTSSTILFVGFVGVKGPKPRAKDLSSRIRQFVYDSKLHLAIIKKEPKDTKQVLFCCDGSEISFEGLTNAIFFAKKFGFHLTVLHAFNSFTKQHCKSVKLRLKQTQQIHKDLTFKVQCQEQELLSCLKAVQGGYDWIMINKNGSRGAISQKKFVGSSTALIIEQIDCNLILFTW